MYIVDWSETLTASFFLLKKNPDTWGRNWLLFQRLEKMSENR